MLGYPHAARLNWKKEAEVARETRGAALGVVDGRKADLGNRLAIDRWHVTAIEPRGKRTHGPNPSSRAVSAGRTERGRGESLTCRGMTALQPALVRAARHPAVLASIGASVEYVPVAICCQRALTPSPSPRRSSGDSGIQFLTPSCASRLALPNARRDGPAGGEEGLPHTCRLHFSRGFASRLEYMRGGEHMRHNNNFYKQKMKVEIKSKFFKLLYIITFM